MMKNLKIYDIEILNLTSEEKINYYNLDKSFFELNSESEVKNGSIKAKVILRKIRNKIEVDFFIEGIVELECDRTLEKFHYQIQTMKKVFFQLGDKNEEISIDHYIINEQTFSINIWQHLYDFIIFAIPIKKLHPDVDDFCENDKIIYQTK